MRAKTAESPDAISLHTLRSELRRVAGSGCHGGKCNRLREEALALAAGIAAFPPLQVGLAKRLLWENAGERDPEEIMRRERQAFFELLRATGRAKPL